MDKPLKLRGNLESSDFSVEIDWLVKTKFPNLKGFLRVHHNFYEEKYLTYQNNKVICYHIQKNGLYFNGIRYISYDEFIKDYKKAYLKMLILHPIIDKGFFKDQHKLKIRELVKEGIKVKIPFVKDVLDFDKNVKLRKKLIIYYLLKQPWIIPYFLYKVFFVNKRLKNKSLKIAFIGVDGSGKTTYINYLKNFFKKNNIKTVSLGMGIYHKRTKFLEILSKIYWKLKSKKSLKRDIEKGGSVKVPTTIKNILRFVDLYLRYVKLNKKGKIVLFDRYFYDFIFYKKPNFIDKVLIKLAPKPDLIFYLKGDPKIINNRKKEYSTQFLEDAMKRMDKYIKKLNLNVINTTLKNKKKSLRLVLETILSSDAFLKYIS